MTNEIEPRKPTDAPTRFQYPVPDPYPYAITAKQYGSFAVDSLGLPLLFAGPCYGVINSLLNTTYIVIDSVIDRLASRRMRAHLRGTKWRDAWK